MSTADDKSSLNQPTFDPSKNAGAANHSFPAQYKSLQDIREFVAQQASDYNFSSNEIHAIQMAVDEAFTNIIEHAYGGECAEDIECSCITNEEGFSIFIIDNGKPFDPTEIPEPDTSTPLEEREIGGLGVHFMRKYMDEVQFSRIPKPDQAGDNCNQLVMVKHKPDRP